MNIKINTIVSMAFAMLFSSVPVMGAVTATAVNESTFTSAKGLADWTIDLYNGSGDELWTSTGGPSTITQHDDWYQGGFAEEVDKTWMNVYLSHDGVNTLTLSFGEVFSLQTITRSGISPIVEIDTSSTTTIWLGIKSGTSNTNLSTSTYDSQINGQFIPELHVSGNEFSALNFATNEAFDLQLTIKMERESTLPAYYGGGQSQLHIFGDNTLAGIPEPSSATLLGIFGILILFRRRKE